jgi:hypothetical protein
MGSLPSQIGLVYIGGIVREGLPVAAGEVKDGFAQVGYIGLVYIGGIVRERLIRWLKPPK